MLFDSVIIYVAGRPLKTSEDNLLKIERKVLGLEFNLLFWPIGDSQAFLTEESEHLTTSFTIHRYVSMFLSLRRT